MPETLAFGFRLNDARLRMPGNLATLTGVFLASLHPGAYNRNVSLADACCCQNPLLMPEPCYHPLYLRGIEQFNRCEFFESHELWEQLWLEVQGKERSFYKGLIQSAVALFHLNNGNVHGAKKLLAGARRYLGPYGSHHLGLNLDEFLADLSKCVEDALAHCGPRGKPLVNLSLIPEIRLQPSPEAAPGRKVTF